VKKGKEGLRKSERILGKRVTSDLATQKPSKAQNIRESNPENSGKRPPAMSGQTKQKSAEGPKEDSLEGRLSHEPKNRIERKGLLVL